MTWYNVIDNEIVEEVPVLPELWTDAESVQHPLRQWERLGHIDDLNSHGWFKGIPDVTPSETEEVVSVVKTVDDVAKVVNETVTVGSKPATEVREICKVAAYDIIQTAQEPLTSPLDSLLQVKTSYLQGLRGKGKPLDAGQESFLDAMETDPRVLGAVALADAAEAIIADIEADVITTVEAVQNDVRWPA